MIVNNNEPNFTFITSSFTANEDLVGNPIKEIITFHSGACLSTSKGESVILSGAFGFENGGIGSLAGTVDDKFYLGISSALSGSLTGIGLFNSEKREEKNAENESFWTWLELFNTGQHIGLDTDIIFDPPIEFSFNNYGAFEEYDKESIFKFSYKEEGEFISQIFQEESGDLVFFEEKSSQGEEYKIESLDSYQTGDKKTEMGLINFEERLITLL